MFPFYGASVLTSESEYGLSPAFNASEQSAETCSTVTGALSCTNSRVASGFGNQSGAFIINILNYYGNYDYYYYYNYNYL